MKVLNLTAAFLMAVLFAQPIFAQNALSLTATSTGEATIVTTIAASEVRVRQASGPFIAYYVTDSAATPGRVRIEPGASYSFFGISGGGYSATATVGSIRLVAGGPVAFEVIQLPKSTGGVTSFNTRVGAVTTQASDIPDNGANTSGTASNLSGTPALPNGTTATTQAASDNTTKLATDAFVMANSTHTVASGTQALATSLISSGTCATAITVAATGALTTDNLMLDFTTDPTAITGYVPATTGVLTIFKYLTADTVHIKVCNMTFSDITPGAATLAYRVVR